MAEITKLLGIAIADADAWRITRRQLFGIFQDAIDNGDILDEANQRYVVAAVFPLLDAGALRRSEHVATFEQRMNRQAKDFLRTRHARDN